MTVSSSGVPTTESVQGSEDQVLPDLIDFDPPPDLAEKRDAQVATEVLAELGQAF
jgi:hypothetical protein